MPLGKTQKSWCDRTVHQAKGNVVLVVPKGVEGSTFTHTQRGVL